MLIRKANLIQILVIASASIWANLVFGQCPDSAKFAAPMIKTNTPQISPKIKISKLIFQGQPGLSPSEQTEIFDSLKNNMGNDGPEWLQEFESRLANAWQVRGYFKAEIKAKALEVSSTPEEKTFIVTAQVESGRRYYLGEIRFLNGTQFRTKEMRAMFQMQTGDLFNTGKIRDGIEALKKAYGAKGFVDFMPVPDTVDDEVHGLISVDIHLNEGRQFHIVETKTLGLDPVSAKALLLNSGLEPGNVLDSTSIELFRSAHPAIEVMSCLDDAKSAFTLYIGYSQPQPDSQ